MLQSCRICSSSTSISIRRTSSCEDDIEDDSGAGEDEDAEVDEDEEEEDEEVSGVKGISEVTGVNTREEVDEDDDFFASPVTWTYCPTQSETSSYEEETDEEAEEEVEEEGASFGDGTKILSGLMRRQTHIVPSSRTT